MLLGIIFFIVGIVVFFEPGGTYLALSVLFGIVVILSGAFELYLGTKAPTGSGKGWYIAGGVVEILLGILLLCTPSMLFTILPFVLGFWLLFRGFMAVGVASEMMGVGIKGAGWTMTLGILVIISAFLVDYRCRCSRVLGGIVPAAGRCRFDCTRCHSAAVAQGAVTVDNVPIRLRPGNILPGRSVFYTDSR